MLLFLPVRDISNDSEVDVEEKTYVRHDMFTKIRVSVSPCGAMRDHVVSTCCAELGHHQRGCCCGDDDGAVQVQSPC